jgi:probable phosphoglycerate mutase
MNDVELVVVRHGRTDWNAARRFQGHSDVPLDATGRAQARALARALGHERFSLAVTSDLARARETAAIVVGAGGPRLECDERWREMRFGAWEGLRWDEIVARFPEAAEPPPGGPFATPEGGESFESVCERVRAAVNDVRRRLPQGGTVLVATHAGALHALLRVALDEDAANALKVRFEPGTITRLVLGEAGPRITLLNHVPPAAEVA